ncbi:isocitrate dehydrogenase [Candidatus Caldarchaeum subterraneum]|uniref:Isocitrate dehydrogenase n=1 Tax=Caldiarchaeum subterraneum TaxID=311458 RepID=E6N5Z9_CALS0|nr:isocitrate dehydrogenase [Candidatus Caldarchaeum subterraneum]BAJ47752.1 isocitrate dehydrogenase [Candidatus Caldarchaeum subterraneum]BAJ49424.1 isocitrate dehydrogenase [Candidatus Caldarchaeum subterraneum]BAJ50621.1 isocitrate dehydrogenase [Candidatus Caldarchaeum subterraneum]
MRKAVLIKGDGTGPELAAALKKVLEAVSPPLEIIECEAGSEWWMKHGGNSMIPAETWEAIRSSDACFKSPTTTPPDPNAPRSVAVSIRQAMDLYANIRPIKTFKGAESPLSSIFGPFDFVCVREATEGLYSGLEHRLSDDVSIAIRKITRRGSERVARWAFKIAAERNWSKVIVITKRNILRVTDGVFWEAVETVAKEFPGISYEEYYIDNMSQQLIKNPDRFNQNVLLSTNLFMDVLSEAAAGLVGNIGMVYAANIGDRYAMFEPAHGSAPKYKGMDRVNPTATILAGAWMLKYLGLNKYGEAIEKATEQVIAEHKVVTVDLGGTAKTSEMAAEIAKKASQIIS